MPPKSNLEICRDLTHDVDLPTDDANDDANDTLSTDSVDSLNFRMLHSQV